MNDKVQELLQEASNLLDEGYKELNSGGEEGVRRRSIIAALDKVEGAMSTLDPTRKIERAREIEKTKGAFDSEYHESFGVMSMTRCSGSSTMVGSFVSTHNNYINLRIYPARRHTGLGVSDFTSHKHAIVEISFTPDQLGDLLGSSSGRYVPCTINSIHGVTMDPPPTEGQSDLNKIKEALEADIEPNALLEEAASVLINLKETIRESSITKKLQNEFITTIDKAIKPLRTDDAKANWLLIQLKHTVPPMLDRVKTMVNAYIDKHVPEDVKMLAKKHVADTFNLGEETSPEDESVEIKLEQVEVKKDPAMPEPFDEYVSDDEIVSRFTNGDDWMAPDWHNAIKARTEEIAGSTDERLSELLEIGIKVDAQYGPQEGFLKACAKEAARRLDRRDFEDSLVLGAADRLSLSYLKQLQRGGMPGTEELSELISAIIDRRAQITKPMRPLRD